MDRIPLRAAFSIHKHKRVDKATLIDINNLLLQHDSLTKDWEIYSLKNYSYATLWRRLTKELLVVKLTRLECFEMKWRKMFSFEVNLVS